MTHNELPEGAGCGNTTPDWKIDEDGTIRIRSERCSPGGGRVYMITVTAQDDAGNVTTEIMTVTVAHDQGH